MIILEIETTTIKAVQEVFSSHHIETIQSIQIDKIKTLEVVHQNIDDKSIR